MEMNPHVVLISGIVFMAVGLLFCGIACYLKSPSSVQKAPLGRIAGTIFYIIGAITLASGLVAVLFRKEATKTAVQAGFLVYLVLLTALCCVFVALVKDGTR